MKDARRIVVWLLALIAVVAAGDRTFSALLNEVLMRSRFRYSRIYRGDSDAAIVIIGDSRGVNSFYAPAIEQLTGQRVLNISFNLLSPRVGEALLADYLERNRPPRVVVFEVSNLMDEMTLATELRTYANVSPRLAALYAEQHPVAMKAGRALRLLAFNSEFFFRALLYFRRSDQDWINHNVISPELLADHGTYSLFSRPDNLAALSRTVRLLQQRGIAVRLVITPYVDPGKILDVEPYERTIEAATGLPVTSYIAEGGAPENFSDRVHMNERGATEFARLMHRDGVFTPPVAAVAARSPR